MALLDKEFEYYKQHEARLIKKHRGEWVVISGEELIAFYPTQDEALAESLKTYTPGTFLVQKCEKEENQIMRFHSRVTFDTNDPVSARPRV